MSENNLVPAEPGGQLVAPAQQLTLPPLIGENGPTTCVTWCSFKAKSKKEKAMLYLALNGGGLEFISLIDHEIPLVNIAIQAKDEPDPESGEMRRVNVTTLFLADGRVASGTSAYLCESIHNLIHSGWNPPFDPPLIVVIRKHKGTRGPYYKLEIASHGVDVDEHFAGSSPMPGATKRK